MTATLRGEAAVLELLRRRYNGKSGNGEEWAFMPHVRNAAGFSATRTIDAIAMSLWPSRGLEIHGHEVKCSRSDWQRELRQPAKMEEFAALVDRWWIVVSDKTIVHDGELPPTWGLMVASGRGVTVKVAAPKLRKVPGAIERSFLASLLRSGCRVGATPRGDVADAERRGRADGERGALDQIESLRRQLDRQTEQFNAFSRVSGIPLYEVDFERLGAAVKAALNGGRELQRFEEQLQGLRHQAARILAAIDQEVGTDGH
jgi:hypothetical protein